MKIFKPILSALLFLSFSGCGNTTQSKSYSFSGNNNLVTIEDGFIIYDGTNGTFDGGILNLSNDVDLSSYSECVITFFSENDKGEKQTLYSIEYTKDNIPTSFKDFELGSISSKDFCNTLTIPQLQNSLYLEIMGTIGTDEYEIISLDLNLIENK